MIKKSLFSTTNARSNFNNIPKQNYIIISCFRKYILIYKLLNRSDTSNYYNINYFFFEKILMGKKKSSRNNTSTPANHKTDQADQASISTYSSERYALLLFHWTVHRLLLPLLMTLLYPNTSTTLFNFWKI